MQMQGIALAFRRNLGSGVLRGNEPCPKYGGQSRKKNRSPAAVFHGQRVSDPKA
jgi:hypothetical protein